MQEEKSYDQFIQKIILADRELHISEVHELKNIYSSYFNRELYSEVMLILKQGKLEQLPQDVLPGDPLFGQYLEVYEFLNENGQKYLATVYDSDELWQDPQIIDIFLV